MSQQVVKTRKRARQSMLRKPEELFSTTRRINLPWLSKLTAELDLEIEEIIIMK